MSKLSNLYLFFFSSIKRTKKETDVDEVTKSAAPVCELYGVTLCRVIIGLGRAMLCTGNARERKKKEIKNDEYVLLTGNSC